MTGKECRNFVVQATSTVADGDSEVTIQGAYGYRCTSKTLSDGSWLCEEETDETTKKKDLRVVLPVKCDNLPVPRCENAPKCSDTNTSPCGQSKKLQSKETCQLAKGCYVDAKWWPDPTGRCPDSIKCPPGYALKGGCNYDITHSGRCMCVLQNKDAMHAEREKGLYGAPCKTDADCCSGSCLSDKTCDLSTSRLPGGGGGGCAIM